MVNSSGPSRGPKEFSTLELAQTISQSKAGQPPTQGAETFAPHRMKPPQGHDSAEEEEVSQVLSFPQVLFYTFEKYKYRNLKLTTQMPSPTPACVVIIVWVVVF